MSQKLGGGGLKEKGHVNRNEILSVSPTVTEGSFQSAPTDKPTYVQFNVAQLLLQESHVNFKIPLYA